MGEQHDMSRDRDWDARGPNRRPEPDRAGHADHAWQVARRMLESGSPRAAGPASLLHLQRIAGNGGVGSLVGGDQDEEHSPVLDVVGKGGGSPLPGPVRTEMEAGLGADFGSVRVHDGPQAAASAHAVQAQAYTVGDEIVFDHGAYQPGTEPGRHTLAHELTHVVQQRSGPVEGTPTGDGVSVSDPGDRFELDAEATASRFSAGTIGVQRATSEDEIEETDELQRTPLEREGEEELEEEDESV